MEGWSVKYLHTIVSYFLKHPKQVTTTGELAKVFKIEMEDREIFQKNIKTLVESGFLSKSKKKRISLIEKQWVVGQFLGNQSGYGFVNEENDNLFIPNKHTNGAIHQDIVLALRVKKGFPSDEGVVINILKRKLEVFVGTFTEINEDGDGFVVALDTNLEDVFIPFENRGSVNNYDYVRCEIVKPKREGKSAVGRVLGVIQIEEINESHLQDIIDDRGIPTVFSKKAIKDAESASFKLDEVKNRQDLLNKLTFTIDGADAKDLDDAISIESLPNGLFRLGVHIADVSEYVKEGTALDKEAYERGTSVYFPNKVIPMLPSKLSNGLCSLHPNTEKLTLSVFMDINSKGDVVHYEIKETVINSVYRFTYEDVTAFLNGENDSLVDEKLLRSEFSNAKQELENKIVSMGALAHILHSKRMDRGAISFHRNEAKAYIDEAGVVSIEKRSGDIGHRLIEEAMLLCNETIAKHFMNKNIPFLYRTHHAPSNEKMDDFSKFIERYGMAYQFPEELKPADIQDYLKTIEMKPEFMAFQFYLLRCMMQAKYEPNCLGHFGLAAEYYTHFTSPIRRYPDLMIHRVVKAYCRSQLHEGLKNEWAKRIEDVAKHCSKRERIAEKAERDYLLLQQLKWGEQHIEDVFEAFISDVQKTFLTVQLDNTVTFKIRFKQLEENPVVNEETLTVQTNTNIYRLGDKVVVQLIQVDWISKELIARIISKL